MDNGSETPNPTTRRVRSSPPVRWALRVAQGAPFLLGSMGLWDVDSLPDDAATSLLVAQRHGASKNQRLRRSGGSCATSIA
jgi:hypothetical protein